MRASAMQAGRAMAPPADARANARLGAADARRHWRSEPLRQADVNPCSEAEYQAAVRASLQMPVGMMSAARLDETDAGHPSWRDVFGMEGWLPPDLVDRESRTSEGIARMRRQLQRARAWLSRAHLRFLAGMQADGHVGRQLAAKARLGVIREALDAGERDLDAVEQSLDDAQRALASGTGLDDRARASRPASRNP